MKTYRKILRDAHKHWSIARLHRKISRLVRLQMTPEEAEKYLEKIGHVIFWLSVASSDGLGTKVAYLFRMDVKTLSRLIGAPTSPQLIADLTEGLHLLRDHAIAFGCWGTPLAPKPASPSVVCPSKEVDEEWKCEAPAYLLSTDAQSANHPWT